MKREAAAVVMMGLLCGAGLFLFQKQYLTSHLWIAAMWGTGAFLLTLMAWTDYREHRIPNILVLLLLVVQLVCLLADRTGFGTEVTREFSLELLTYHAGGTGKDWVDRLLGLVFPMLLILGVEKFYPGGLGAGDEKLFLVLGFTLGFSMAVRLLFLAFLMMAAACMYAMWRKKADRRTVFPMGPAVWAAYLIMGCFP